MSTIKGTAGDDNLTGTSGNDVFNLTQGGDDTVHGLGGNDSFSFGATFTAADSVDGGDGTDTLKLDGDYLGGVVFGATTLVNVENIVLADGNSYRLTTNDATVAAGKSLTVDASALTGENTLTFDGSNETDGSFTVKGGAGSDFFDMGAAMTASDRFDGGGGNDGLSLAGDYTLAFGGSTIRNIADIAFGGGHDYRLTENDNNVAANAVMTIDASAVNGANTFNWNGSHETDGSFVLDGGSGKVTFAGSANSDAIFMGANLTADDRINGEQGADVLYIGGADYNLAMGQPTLKSIDNVKLQGGFDYHITSGGGIATDATQVWDATSLGAGDTLSLNFIKETHGSVIVDGGAAAATIAGTQQGDDFDFSVTGQGGFTASDRINGEGGYDRLQLGGDYTGANALVLGAHTVTNVEEFDFDPGHSYDITIAAGTIAANSGLSVNAHLLGATDVLTFDGSAAASNMTLVITGGAGNDVLTGGAGNDDFDLTFGGSDTATGGAGNDTFSVGNGLLNDSIDGGAGNDIVVLNGNYATTLGSATLQSVGTLKLTDGHNYTFEPGSDLATADPNLVYNASGLSAAYRVYVDADLGGDAAGSYTIIGGAGGDSFRAGHDATASDIITFQGNGGSDTLIFDTTSANAYIVSYAAVSDSTSTGYDVIGNENFHTGLFSVSSVAGTVTGIDAKVTTGALSTASFDTDLAAAIDAGHLGAHHAVLFTANSGTLSGDTFLIVDANGTPGYQASQDLVIQLVHATGTLTTGNFF